MQKDKYYIPSIEEFYVGFEFEYRDLEYEGRENYKPCKVSSSENLEYLNGEYIGCFEHLLAAIEYVIKHDRIRVKYLDEEDILSLGFTKPDSMFTTYKFKEFVISTHRKVLHDNNTVTTLYSGYVITKNGRIIFEGIIKNKSQLKLLMKQLNTGI